MKNKQPPSTEKTQKADNNMNTNNINASSVLETLHPATVKALEGLYFQKFVSAMSSTIGVTPVVSEPGSETNDIAQPVKRQGRPKGSKNKVVETPVKKGPGRPAGSKNKAKDDEEVETKKAKKDLGPSGRAKATASATVGKRVLTKDGRTASQVIRDYDDENPEAKANDVVEHCHSLGLKNVVPANVYNVRQNLKKAAEAAAEAKAARKAAKEAKAAEAEKAAKKAAKEKASKKAKKAAK
jgi:hypothetical protein